MILDLEGVLHLDSGLPDERTKMNSAAKFTTYLHHSLQFTSDQHEVALHEIQIPQTYFNIPKEQKIVAYSNTEGVISPIRTFSPGCYYSIYEITNEMNKLFRDQSDRGPRFEYDSILKRVVSVGGMVGKRKGHIFVTEDLSRVLGFDKRYMSFTETVGLPDIVQQYKSSELYFVFRSWSDSLHAEHPLCLNFMIPRLQVHCSLVKQLNHGSNHLLRVIPLETNPVYGSIIAKSFERPIFVPLSGNLFDRVDISITDHEGNLISFQALSVLLTLEFRKKNAFQ